MDNIPMWVMLTGLSILFCLPLIVYLVFGPHHSPNEPPFTRVAAVVAIGIMLVGIIFALGGFQIFGLSALSIGGIVLHLVIWNLRQFQKRILNDQ